MLPIVDTVLIDNDQILCKIGITETSNDTNNSVSRLNAFDHDSDPITDAKSRVWVFDMITQNNRAHDTDLTDDS